ncbi:kinesin-like protein KIF16B [Gouania willdenowi]|uniref:kinesin-like protein KIF16B n=1 Tax=Gouania willdenowi TaxID=441366 RepID=UPI001054E041|nr:kinesin-like protein KIF16B [Gouania willdenowi]
MTSPLTVVGDVLKDGGKSFSFDYSYDSSDRESPAYASQEKIFEDIGHDVLKAAFEGFNVCIFAYGQSGSGKSYTMMGHKEDQGLIPRVCEGLFLETSRGKTDAAIVHTEVSYLEIYNEHVLDLLKTRSPFTVGGRLRVREHPKDGPYVENLSKIAVNNYNELKDLIAVGDNNRTTASTDMNDVSSRSHAIFTIMLTQVFSDAGPPHEVLSKINLVDLAGSERVDSSQTKGSRLKEGANINKSLVTLGSVISALADMSVGVQSTKKKQLYIPYRNSVLTWLLKDSLGGNAMTTMIATISPADLNYMETLTTLRYASRVKNIQNSPTVNEDGSMKTSQLQAEVLKLQKQLEEATQALQEKWSASVKEEKLQQNKEKDEIVSLRREGNGVVVDCQLPHLIGINEDPCSTNITLYLLKEGTTKIGSDEALCDQNIVLPGSGILSWHCVIENRAGTVTLFPQHGALCSVNESVVMDTCQLTQGAIIRFGRETIFKFNHPTEASQLRRKHKSRLLSSSTLSSTDFCRSTNNPANRRWQSPCKMNADRDDFNDPDISFTSVPALKETTVIQGSHPVPHNTFELDGDTLLHGVSTRDGRQQERDLYHQSGPRPVFEMLQTEAHSEAKIASYQVELWSGDASLQQATLLSLGDGCDMEPRGNANEFQGVVTECNKGRPDSGGSSLGCMSHLQSSGQTSSVWILA